ncbi:MAG: SCO family protein [Stellaceae bacterium]
MTRRRASGAIGAVLAIALLQGCNSNRSWHAIDVSGSSPSLAFTLSRAPDGKTVTAADYRGKVVLLYLGYTYCPDVCPTTLANLSDALKRLGPEASHIRVLFVTVDPARDTLPVLASYAKSFAAQVQGLRGTPDQLAAVARRYRLVYSVKPGSVDEPEEVTHSSAIYVFDKTGAARLLIASLSTTNPDIAGTAVDLKRLVEDSASPSLLARLLRLV